MTRWLHIVSVVIPMAALLVACDKSFQHMPATNSGIVVADKLGKESPAGSFARAYRSRRFAFPNDHVAHTGYKHEWWYFSGNLATNSGRRFGYQLTLFRIGIAGDEEFRDRAQLLRRAQFKGNEKRSRWRADNFYMAHFALTDVSSKRFFNFERFQRSALGLAGALQKGAETKTESKAIRLWIEDWIVDSVTNQVFPIRLSAEQDDIRIKLNLDQLKPIVLNGDEGLLHKGRKPGNASYYYSMPRLETEGTIVVEGETFRVDGTSWFDHEWSTSVLEKDQVGWDWFALQLDDGRDIMFYKLRRTDGGMDDFSTGTYVKKDGTYEPILARDVEIDVVDEWRSDRTGINYPSAWTIKLLRHDIELSISPLVEGQEMDLAVKYWEGSVRVTGRHLNGNQTPIGGYGYVELAGYKRS